MPRVVHETSFRHPFSSKEGAGTLVSSFRRADIPSRKMHLAVGMPTGGRLLAIVRETAMGHPSASLPSGFLSVSGRTGPQRRGSHRWWPQNGYPKNASCDTTSVPEHSQEPVRAQCESREDGGQSDVLEVFPAARNDGRKAVHRFRQGQLWGDRLPGSCGKLGYFFDSPAVRIHADLTVNRRGREVPIFVLGLNLRIMVFGSSCLNRNITVKGENHSKEQPAVLAENASTSLYHNVPQNSRNS